ncbi:Retrotransposon protein, Ty3-gypsy subclass [Gossypium australe]|uniref:Retrotransposon protein, Ty3-gypsy subclass n=1 Tax=Gossypium australe TaxID=47621 RepID=A0A5B6WT78_9ROSI|nr:Retrotransposon protein, Ty3-gypsy subclass [Gossypium australe]
MVLRFGQKRKLNPHFIESSQIIRRVGHVAYQLELPPELDHVTILIHRILCPLKKLRYDPICPSKKNPLEFLK